MTGKNQKESPFSVQSRKIGSSALILSRRRRRGSRRGISSFSGARGVCGVTVLRLIGFSGTESVFDGGAGLFQRILQRFPQLRHKPVVDPAAADFEPDGELLRR